MVLVDANPYYFAAIGGVLLGIATTINYVLRGRVTGMSGMIYGILTLHKEDIHEKLSIIGGMLIASGIFFDIFGYETSNKFTPFGPAEHITSQTSYIGYALAGLLVGFGTKLSNGCTSGHGLCGLPRFSIRSFVAVCVFLCTAIGISTLRYYVTLGPFTSQSMNPVYQYNHLVSANICIAIGVLLPFIGAYVKSHVDHKMTNYQLFIQQLITFIVGIIFGSGLLVSGMVRRSNILGFLGLGQNWNPSLLFVLGCGVIINLISFTYMIRVKKESLLGRHLFNPDNKTIDWKLVGGAACFGLGWGIGGLCPGPAIMQLSVFTLPIHVIWVGCMLTGMVIARKVQHYLHEEEERLKEEAKAKEELEAKAHHLHHHKHPHRHHDDHNNSHQHHDLDHHPHLPPLKVHPNQPQLQDVLVFNPIADLLKQESIDTIRVTAPESIRQSNANAANPISGVESPSKIK